MLKTIVLAVFALIQALACASLYALEVIVNHESPVSSVTQSELRSIFSMKVRRWEDNAGIKVFILRSDTDLHRNFCMQTLEVFPYQLQRIWDVNLFSGTGVIPIEVSNEQEMLEKVASTPSSIGYISEFKGEVQNVKSLQIKDTP